MTRRGMDDETCGLIDDDQIVVLKYHCERNVFGDEIDFADLRQSDRDLLTAGEFGGSVLAYPASDSDVSGAQKDFDPLTAQFIDGTGNEAIEPQALTLRWHDEPNNRILVIRHLRYRCRQQALRDPS